MGEIREIGEIGEIGEMGSRGVMGETLRARRGWERQTIRFGATVYWGS
jgi:hypothetical protein